MVRHLSSRARDLNFPGTNFMFPLSSASKYFPVPPRYFVRAHETAQRHVARLRVTHIGSTQRAMYMSEGHKPFAYNI